MFSSIVVPEINITLENFRESFSFSESSGTCPPGIDRRLDAMFSSGNSLRSRRFVSFVVCELRDTAARNPRGEEVGQQENATLERSCRKEYSAIIPRILNWAIVLRNFYLL